MLIIPRDALPWIIIFVVVLLVLAFLAWTGLDRWGDLDKLAAIATLVLLRQL